LAEEKEKAFWRALVSPLIISHVSGARVEIIYFWTKAAGARKVSLPSEFTTRDTLLLHALHIHHQSVRCGCARSPYFHSHLTFHVGNSPLAAPIVFNNE
jgi:hypothetical protein